jgi:hypothetical protein
MESTRSLDQLVARAQCVVRGSDALFGYVFALAPDAKTFLRGRPLAGTIQEEKVLQNYYKSVGKRALELLALRQDQAVPVGALDDSEPDRKSWFAVILTQDLGVPACIAVVYPLYSRDEAVRTLHLVEMIMTMKPLI